MMKNGFHWCQHGSAKRWAFLITFLVICAFLLVCKATKPSDNPNDIDPILENGDVPAPVAVPNKQIILVNRLAQTQNSIAPYTIKHSSFGQGDPAKAKVVLFGIDGATWIVLNPLLEKGLLPNFERLIERSSYGILKTDVAFSPVTWTSIATGKRKAKTLPDGISEYAFWGLQSECVGAKRLWDILGQPDGHGVTLINYYYPPSSQNLPRARMFSCRNVLCHGLNDLVADWSRDTAPSTILDQLKATLEDGSFEVMASIIPDTDLIQHANFLYFSVKYDKPFRLFRFVNEADQKTAERLAQAVVDVYQKCDRLVGLLLEKYSDDYIFIVSDHGFRVAPPQIHFSIEPKIFPFPDLPALDFSPERPAMVSLDRFRYAATVLSETNERELLESPQTGESLSLSQKRTGWSFLPDPPGEIEAADALYGLLKDRVDFCNGNGIRELKMERRGNEVQIRPSRDLAGDKPLSGHKLPLRCLRIEQYSGDHLSPDQGIVIASGPGIAKGRLLTGASLFDITPTLLYLKGRAVGEDMDGEVLVEMLDPEMPAQRPIQKMPTHDDEQFLSTRKCTMKELSPDEKGRLKELGYLH